jgi:hypothetical protein
MKPLPQYDTGRDIEWHFDSEEMGHIPLKRPVTW